jgi:flagellar basal-body rod modification protein FlgD
MTVSPVSNDYGMFAANAATSTSGSTNNDSQMFLQLMVAQMKYQDPMNPTDTSSMMAQNATFTEVQAIQEMQSEMGMVLSSQLAFGSAAMIGKNVSWIDANGVTQSGTVTGASFTSSGPVLSVGNQQIAMSDVASVGTVSSTPPASSTSTDTSGTNA